MFKKRLAQTAFGFFVFVLVAMVLFWWMFHSGKPQPSVDYVALINQPVLQVGPNEKAWTVYRDLWLKHGFAEGGSLDLKEIHCQDEEGRHYGPLVRPSDGLAWEAAIEKMAAVPDLVEGLRAGGVLPHFGVPMYLDLTQYETKDLAALFPGVDREALLQAKASGTGSVAPDIRSAEVLTSMPLPQVQTLRSAASLLVVDTRLALEQNDAERAVRNMEAILGMSVQATEGNFINSILSGLAIQSMALDLINECLQSKTHFDVGHLERIDNALQRANIRRLVNLSSERYTWLDLVQRIYTDDGHGDGRMTAVGLDLFRQAITNTPPGMPPSNNGSVAGMIRWTMAPASLLFLPTRKQFTDKTNEVFDRVEAAIRANVSDAEFVQIEQDFRNLPSSYMGLRHLMPAFRMFRDSVVQVETSANATRSTLAALRGERQKEKQQ